MDYCITRVALQCSKLLTKQYLFDISENMIGFRFVISMLLQAATLLFFLRATGSTPVSVSQESLPSDVVGVCLFI